MGGAMDLIAEFGALIDVLNREGIEYAVCGEIAVSIHGYVRATTDIDILIRAGRRRDLDDLEHLGIPLDE
jgi:hypothetical protein